MIRAAAITWLRIALRRWHVELPQLLLLIAVPAAMLNALGKAAPGGGSLTAIWALGLVAAVGMPASPAGRRLVGNVRLDLLPLKPPLPFILRITLLHPVRTLLCAFVAVATCVALLRHGGPAVLRGAEAVQVVAFAIIATCLADLLDTSASRLRRIPLRALLTTSATLALLLLLEADGVRALSDMLARSVDDRWLLGSARLDGAELMAGSLSVVIAFATVLWASSVRARSRASVAASAGGPFARRGRRFALALSPGMTKEVAVIVRHPRIFAGLIWPAGLTAIGLRIGVPLLIPAGCALWALNALNAFGPDLPVAGMQRYALLPDGMSKVVHARHSAFLSALACCILLTWAVIAGLQAVRTPVMGAETRWMYALAGLYGLSLYAAIAAVSGRSAVRWPHWMDAAGRTQLGEEPPVFVTLAVLMAAAAIIVAALVPGILLNIALGLTDAALRSIVLLGAAAAVHLAAWRLLAWERHR